MNKLLDFEKETDEDLTKIKAEPFITIVGNPNTLAPNIYNNNVFNSGTPYDTIFNVSFNDLIIFNNTDRQWSWESEFDLYNAYNFGDVYVSRIIKKSQSSSDTLNKPKLDLINLYNIEFLLNSIYVNNSQLFIHNESIEETFDESNITVGDLYGNDLGLTNNGPINEHKYSASIVTTGFSPTDYESKNEKNVSAKQKEITERPGSYIKQIEYRINQGQ